MDHSHALRIDSHSRQWGGQGFSPDERRKRRVSKLQALYAALKDGDLDGARHAFVALINVDPALNQEPSLTRIGAALQSSQLRLAQQIAQELQTRGLRPIMAEASSSPRQTVATTTAGAWYASGLRRVDFSA
ncbi:MAG: hypothetical protein ACKO69_08750 [Limnohabitans sp.]